MLPLLLNYDLSAVLTSLPSALCNTLYKNGRIKPTRDFTAKRPHTRMAWAVRNAATSKFGKRLRLLLHRRTLGNNQ